MKVFHCQNCQQTVFFENTHCNSCGHLLAFLPETREVAALAPAENDQWVSMSLDSDGRLYRLCSNAVQHQNCNWGVAADDPSPLCMSCRLTRVIPNLEIEGNLQAWTKLETAKRRLLYSLLEMQLPVVSRLESPTDGLAFDFLSDELAPTGRVLTGHDNGLITINRAEADDAEREKRRLKLHEPYRTLLGHFRHEVGHYYWDRLIRDGGHVEAFRAEFGDETIDYAEALKKHYSTDHGIEWVENFVSSYASSHPWEDWAETWAHYMHMIDALETAAACGLSLKPRRQDEPTLDPLPDIETIRRQSFDRMIEDWLALTYALNNLSRSLGQPDSYPFVLSARAIEKLRFVHDLLPRVTPAMANQAVLAPERGPTEQPALQGDGGGSKGVAKG